MHSLLLLAAVALAVASPLEKRDLHTVTVVDTVTTVVWVTQSDAVASLAPAGFFTVAQASTTIAPSSTSAAPVAAVAPSTKAAIVQPPAVPAAAAIVQPQQQPQANGGGLLGGIVGGLAGGLNGGGNGGSGGGNGSPVQVPSAPAGGDYISQCLAGHNTPRAKHGVAPLVWDAGLEATAAKIAARCVFAHDQSTDGGGYGQNLGLGTPASQIYSLIADQFYANEIGKFPGYGIPNPPMGNFGSWGHATQVLWKNTGSVGCHTQDCPIGALTVCNYRSAGNYAGQYAENVLPPR